MKRGRDSLTGGTGDVNPQLLSIRVTQTAADTTTSAQAMLPIQRLAQGSRRAQVMEVLKIYFNSSALPISASATEVVDSITTILSTVNGGTTNLGFNNPQVFAAYFVSQNSAFTAAGTYMSNKGQTPFVQDLTDGAGHGILIATDSIFIQAQSAGTGAANVCDAKVLYRMKDVSIEEYIGIVQSQSAPLTV